MSSTAAADRQRAYRLRPPPPVLALLEGRALLEAAAIPAALPWLAAQPRGDGRLVLVAPGFGADDRSTWPLRQYLRGLGYDARGWGLGRNRGAPQTAAAALLQQLPALRRTDQPVSLVGWSLGGVVARLLAAAAPDVVQDVVTLGTPVEGGPKYTRVGDAFARAHGLDMEHFEARVHAVNSRRVPANLTVVFSRTDGVVGWRAAVDRYNPQARHVEVVGSHIGLGVNPWVWSVVARALAGEPVGGPAPA